MSATEDKKANFRSKEWMQSMREKANAKKAEQKKIKEAEKLKLQKEREQKLKEADEILNPKKKTEPPPHEDEESEPEEVVEKPQRARKQKAEPEYTEPNYKQMYYRYKLESISKQQEKAQQAPPQPQNTPLPYQYAINQFKQDVDKQLMDSLFKTYWKTDKSPYQI